MSSQYHDLPFQWDDGNFISPFVATSEEDVAAVCEWLVSNVIQPRASSVSSGVATGLSVRMRITDLGCGDGSALFFLADHLLTQWGRQRIEAPSSSSSSSSAHLQLQATGVDLDEELIEQANSNIPAAAAAKSSLEEGNHTNNDDNDDNTNSVVKDSVSWEFVSEDIRYCDTSRYFPMEEELTTGTTYITAPHLLFLYLLPDALALLEERITELLVMRRCMVLSNRWPVPYLEQWFVAKVGNVHIYQYK